MAFTTPVSTCLSLWCCWWQKRRKIEIAINFETKTLKKKDLQRFHDNGLQMLQTTKFLDNLIILVKIHYTNANLSDYLPFKIKSCSLPGGGRTQRAERVVTALSSPNFCRTKKNRKFFVPTFLHSTFPDAIGSNILFFPEGNGSPILQSAHSVCSGSTVRRRGHLVGRNMVSPWEGISYSGGRLVIRSR